jgi:hypothetical protein
MRALGELGCKLFAFRVAADVFHGLRITRGEDE